MGTAMNSGRSFLKSAPPSNQRAQNQLLTVENEAKHAPSDKDSQGAIRSPNGALWRPILYIRKELMSRNDMLLQEILACGPILSPKIPCSE